MQQKQGAGRPSGAPITTPSGKKRPDTKIVKAYCAKSKKYFALVCEKHGSVYEVADFTPMSEEEARLVTSEISQDTYNTAKNLIACPKCGTRKAFSCKCAQGAECKPDRKYNFGCLYCKDLKPDYEEAEGVSGRVGEVITLSQGQEVVIRQADNKPLKKIYVGTGWEASRTGNAIDVDSSVLVYNKNGSKSELVYFGRKEYGSCILHHGDNLTGSHGKSPEEDDENIDVDLSAIPAEMEYIVFFINIYQCVSRKQSFRTVDDLYIRLRDPVTKKTLIRYDMTENYGNNTGLVAGIARRSGAGWKFKAIGEAVTLTSVHEFIDYCKKYLKEQ